VAVVARQRVGGGVDLMAPGHVCPPSVDLPSAMSLCAPPLNRCPSRRVQRPGRRVDGHVGDDVLGPVASRPRGAVGWSGSRTRAKRMSSMRIGRPPGQPGHAVVERELHRQVEIELGRAVVVAEVEELVEDVEQRAVGRHHDLVADRLLSRVQTGDSAHPPSTGRPDYNVKRRGAPTSPCRPWPGMRRRSGRWRPHQAAATPDLAASATGS